MAAQGFETVGNVPLPELEPRYREELGICRWTPPASSRWRSSREPPGTAEPSASSLWAFVRTYGFLSCVLPYTNAAWETRSIFLTFLIPKLPAPEEEDLSKGILEAIDMDSYRVEKRAVQKILLPEGDAETDPVPTSGGGHRPEPEVDRLSVILKVFNDLFGDITWENVDRVWELITTAGHDPRIASIDLWRSRGMMRSSTQHTPWRLLCPSRRSRTALWPCTALWPRSPRGPGIPAPIPRSRPDRSPPASGSSASPRRC